MPELASDSTPQDHAFNCRIDGVRYLVQWVGDDGKYRGWAIALGGQYLVEESGEDIDSLVTDMRMYVSRNGRGR